VRQPPPDRDVQHAVPQATAELLKLSFFVSGARAAKMAVHKTGITGGNAGWHNSPRRMPCSIAAEVFWLTPKIELTRTEWIYPAQLRKPREIPIG
jgi:hypothetical protein